MALGDGVAKVLRSNADEGRLTTANGRLDGAIQSTCDSLIRLIHLMTSERGSQDELSKFIITQDICCLRRVQQKPSSIKLYEAGGGCRFCCCTAQTKCTFELFIVCLRAPTSLSHVGSFISTCTEV